MRILLQTWWCRNQNNRKKVLVPIVFPSRRGKNELRIINWYATGWNSRIFYCRLKCYKIDRCLLACSLEDYCRDRIMAMETPSRLKGQKEPKLSIDDVLNNNFRYFTWLVTKSRGNLESSNLSSSKEWKSHYYLAGRSADLECELKGANDHFEINI